MTDICLRRAALVAPVAVFVALSSTACTKSETAQARGRDDVAKKVAVEHVQEQSVQRAVEVVGTLTAIDEVTISSEADGLVNRILHDLGDRVRAGETLVELDREKADYNLAQQKAALDRALAQYGAPDPQHLPPIEQTPDVQKARAELVQARQNYDRTKELNALQLVPRQTLDDADAMLQSKQAS